MYQPFSGDVCQTCTAYSIAAYYRQGLFYGICPFFFMSVVYNLSPSKCKSIAIQV